MNDGDGSDRDHDGVGDESGTTGADVGADVGDGVEADPAATDAEDGREWEFSLEDIQQREADAAAEAEAAQRRRRPLEPGDPSMEGVVFVLLGVGLTLFILSRLVVG